MLAYVARRLLLVVPTLFGIMLANFLIVQAAPGGPVDLVLARLRGATVQATARVGGTGGGETGGGAAGPALGAGEDGVSRAARGIDPELVRQLEKQFGFDKPAWQRFVHMLRNYLVFDLGTSFYRDRPVLGLMLEKLPVSITLGLWTTLLVYFISIPLGVAKAVRDGTPFDVWTSAAVIVGYAIPGFLFAILLVVLLAGGSFVQWFPLRGLTSDTWALMSWPQRIVDYLWHIVLPVTAMVVGGFAGLAMLTKNSFLDEINKHYVATARAKGLGRRRVLYGHVFRNAMLIVVAGFPGAFVGIFFASALLIEVIFSLDGLGLLGFEAAVNRDYPVMFGTLYVYTLIGLLLNIVTDLVYTVIDPRIDFERRDT
ncbi:MAG: microcin C ABC transporter permease YejB [Candidatus Rokuibacteriota bacterium]|nr:MAG: microcin C ABC transporter permease YejB [Candidatus Rokubacteria bacterium]